MVIGFKVKENREAKGRKGIVGPMWKRYSAVPFEIASNENSFFGKVLKCDKGSTHTLCIGPQERMVFDAIEPGLHFHV